MKSLVASLLAPLRLLAPGRNRAAGDEAPPVHEAAQDAIVTLDGADRIIGFNPAAEQLFGWRAADCSGRPAIDLLLPAGARASFRAELQALADEAAHGGSAARREIECLALHADGRRIPTLLSVVVHGRGRSRRCLAYLRDLSAQTHALAALAASEARWRELVENLSELVFETDAQSCWSYLNPAWEHLTGIPVAQALGQPLPTLCQAEDQASLLVALRPLYLGEVSQVRTELRCRGGDGQPRWLELVARARRGADGALLGLSGSASDITDRRRLQERLSGRLDFLAQIIEVLPNPVYVKDHEGRYVAFNRAFEEFFGVDRNRWIGQTVFDLYDNSEMSAWHHARDSELLAAGGVQRLETRVRDRRGQLREALYHKVCFGHGDGRSGILGVITDNSAHKETERALCAARDAAEAASCAKSRFLANVSHELRTPMNAILGMTGLLQETPLAPQQRDYLQQAHEAAHSLLQVLNDVIEYARIESGQQQPQPRLIALHDLLRECLRRWQPAAQMKGLDLRLDISAEVPPQVCADPGLLGEVLDKLLDNAIKFTERGGVILTLRLVYAEAQRLVLRFAVRDSGVGMDARARAQAFEAFTQADSSATRRHGGTGLGLAICRRAVEAWGGEIGLESEPGRGSTVHFSLPCERTDSRPVQLFDADEALTRVGGDPELLRQIAQLAIAERASMQHSLARACASGDLTTLTDAAHTIKGVVGNFGIGPAYQAAIELHMACRAGQQARAQQLVPVLQAHLDALCAALQTQFG